MYQLSEKSFALPPHSPPTTTLSLIYAYVYMRERGLPLSLT